MSNFWLIILKLPIPIFFLLIIALLLREARAIKCQKRLERFALISIHDSEKSIFDNLLEKYWKFVQNARLIASKSALLKNYSQRYEKYIAYEEKEHRCGLDYIIIKITIMAIFLILNIVAYLLPIRKISGLSFIISSLVGFFLPDVILTVEYQQKRKQIEEDLLKAIIIMNNSFKSGRNIMQAVDIVKKELTGPISDEFKKIGMDMTYGLSLDIVFDRFYERVKLDDAKYIASSLSLLSRTGGNITEVFGTIEKSFFEKKKLNQEMKSLTAASIFVFRVLIFLPVIFTLIITAMNPKYFAPFFETPFGFLLFLLIIILYILYIIVIRKALKVKM